MVGRLRERQYQLAAQKQNEAFLKYNHYVQTARYFERECQIARHYDSWNVKDLDAKKHLEEAKKTERLLTRRTKLKTLLKEEEESYRREIDELKARKLSRRSEPASLEALREKLKEKRAEQSLYLPRTCRRYQSYFVYPTESAVPHLSAFRSPGSQRSRVCRDTTNFLSQSYQQSPRKTATMSANERKSPPKQDTLDACHESMRSIPYAVDLEEMERPSTRFLRHSRRSLENTNVRTEDAEEQQEYVPSRRLNRSTPSFESPQYGATEDLNGPSHDKENRKSETKLNGYEDSPVAEDKPTAKEEPSAGEKAPDTAESSEDTTAKDEADKSKAAEDTIAQQAGFAKDDRQFEREKSLPWLRMDPHDKNLSKQMFLYLTHKELKCKIEDLSRRESHACNKQSWDEALRLRDMRNRLELIREKRLYNTENLELDAEAKAKGLTSIDKREQQLAEREDACTDSTMYSEDAKALWKKWVREDEQSAIMDARSQRETLMQKLEKEWQSLAIREKEKITDSFRDTMSTSSLHEEHKMAAALSASRTKSATSRR